MRTRAFWVGLLAIALLACSWLAGTPSALAYSEEQKILLQAWRTVNQAYLDDSFNGHNWWLVRQRLLRRNLAAREETYDAIEEMLATLDDPFTRLLRPEQYRSLQVSTAGELSGVGLQIDLDTETQQLQVVAPIAGSPADAAGIQPRDRILAIDGTSTQGMSLDEAASRMRGPVGSIVTLEVQAPGATTARSVAIRRDRIELNPVTARLDTDSSPLPIGYLRLSQFSANATAELRAAIADLQARGAQAFLLDLRNNPGGLLQAGIEVARLWLEDSTIVYTVNRQGAFDSFAAGSGAIAPQQPLAVLVNGGTASASEILAGALQDNGRATLVGERTFGKGLIQSLFELPDRAGLAVTVAKYETPNHTDIHRQGIVPDVVVPQEPLSLLQIGTPSDRQYQAAVKLLSQELEAAARDQLGSEKVS